MRRVVFGALTVLPLALFVMTACSDDIEGEAARRKAAAQSRFNDDADDLAKIYLSCGELVTARTSCGKSQTATRTLRPTASPTDVAGQLEDLLSKFEEVLERAKKDICAVLENFPSKEQVPKDPATKDAGKAKGRRPPGDYFIVGKKLAGTGTATIAFDMANKEAAVLVSDGKAIPTLSGTGDYHGWALSTPKDDVVSAWSGAGLAAVNGSRLVLPASELYEMTASAFKSADDTLVGGVASGALTTDIFGEDLAAPSGANLAPSNAGVETFETILERINEGAKKSPLGRAIIRYDVVTSGGKKFFRFDGPVDTALAILAVNPDEGGSVAALQVLAESSLSQSNTTVSQICKDSGGTPGSSSGASSGSKRDGGSSSGSSGGGSSGGGSGGSSGGAGSGAGARDGGAGGGSGGADAGAPTDERLEKLIDLLERLLEPQADAGARRGDGGEPSDGGAVDAEALDANMDGGKGDCNGNADGWWCVDPQIYGTPYMVRCENQGIALGFECASCTRGGTPATCTPPQ